MGDQSTIEWTDATWNPTVGCTKVSPGCDHCYAETFVNRFAGTKGFPLPFDQMLLRTDRFIDLPRTWREPRKVFVNSLSDLFHASVPDELIVRVFQVMAETPRHTYQLLTKRHGRMRSFLTEHQAEPLPNVWLGVSVEDQHWADIRIPALLGTPAAVRWISAEPLLGPVTLKPWLSDPAWVDGDLWPPSNARERTLDWVVVGGESGPGARPMDPDWARTLRDECAATNRYSGMHWMGGPPAVQFLFKQWGSHDANGRNVGKKAAGRVLDGQTYDGYPQVVAA